jgi:hypothetical protein
MDKAKSGRMSHNLLTAARLVCYGLLAILTALTVIIIFVFVYFRKTGRLLGEFTAEQMEWKSILLSLFGLVLLSGSLWWVARDLLADDEDPRGEE